MKYKFVGFGLVELGRTPHGVRGLKFQLGPVGLEFVESHPSRGAWIEIKISARRSAPCLVAPLTGCVD